MSVEDNIVDLDEDLGVDPALDHLFYSAGLDDILL